MNVSESTALFNFVEGLTDRDADPYEVLEALVVLVERAHKALGAGPSAEQVLTRISKSATSVQSAGFVFFPLVDAAGYMADELFVERRLEEAAR